LGNDRLSVPTFAGTTAAIDHRGPVISVFEAQSRRSSDVVDGFDGGAPAHLAVDGLGDTPDLAADPDCVVAYRELRANRPDRLGCLCRGRSGLRAARAVKVEPDKRRCRFPDRAPFARSRGTH
jgi:hypothetical protein